MTSINKDIKIIKENSKLLIKLYSQTIPASQKVGIIQQLQSNLKFLKDKLDESEFQEEFGVIDTKLNKVVENLTSTSFLTELVEKLKNIKVQ